MTIPEIEQKIRELQSQMPEIALYVLLSEGELFDAKDTFLAYTSYQQALVKKREYASLRPRLFRFTAMEEVK